MAKNKLENLRELYENDPTDSNLLRYVSCLITYHKYDEALMLLDKVTDISKQDVAILYRAKIYKYKGDEEKFFDTLSGLMNTELNYEAYVELAEFYQYKLVSLKKKIKTRELQRNPKIEKEIESLYLNIKDNLKESLNIKKNSNALLRYAELEFFQENYEEAKKYFLIILEDSNLKIQLKDLYYVKLRLATIYLQEEDIISAENLVDSLLNDKYPYKSKAFLLKAQLLMKNGKLIEAQKYYKKGLQDGGSPVDNLEYAKLCINLSLYDEAIIYLNKVKETYLKNRAIQEEAKLNVSLGRYKEGIELYSKMLDGSQIDINIANIGIGSAYRLLGNYGKAIEWLDKSLNGNEKDKILASIELAKVYEELSDFTRAKKLLNYANEKSCGKYGKLEYAKLLLKNQELEKAREILMDVISNSSNIVDHQEGLMTLAILEKSLGNIVETKSVLKELLYLKNRTYYKALCIMIECNLELGEFEEAKDNIEKLNLSESRIDLERLSYYQAELFRLQGNKLFAEEKYLAVLKRDNTNIQALNGLANLYKTSDNYKFFEIINVIRNLSKNNNAMANYLEASYYFDKGQFRKSLNLLIENITYQNDYKDSSIVLCGEIEELCDNYSSAIDYYSKINDSKSRLYAKAIFKIAKIYLKNNELEKSLVYFNKLIEMDSNYKNLAKVNLAIIYGERKEYKIAEEMFEEFENTKYSAYAKLELAKMKIKQGKFDEAVILLEKILDSSSRYHAMLELIKLKSKLGEYYEALSYAEILIDESDNHQKRLAMYEQARIYTCIGKYNIAQNIYLNLLSEEVNNELDNYDTRFQNNILLELGQIERRLGNVDTAIDYFEMIKSTREKVYACCELIDIEIERKNFDKAIYYINEIKDSFMSDNVIIKLIGIYLELGEYAKIHPLCDKIKNEENRDIAIYRNALAYFGEENFEEAKKSFLKLIDNDGEFKALSKLYLGKIEFIMKNYNEARKYFNMGELNASSLRQLMFIDLKEEKYEDALFKAIQLFESSTNYNEKEKNSIIISFLSKQLNILLPQNYYGYMNTLKENVIDYNLESAYNFIIEKSLNDNIFNNNVDFSLLLDIIESKLDDNHFIRNSGFDEYIIEINNIGATGENYLKVCTLPNTKNIISMYPVETKYDFHSEYVRKKNRNEF